MSRTGAPDAGVLDAPPRSRSGSDRLFYAALLVIPGVYVLLILLMLLADFVYMVDGNSAAILEALQRPAIRHSIVLSLLSCSVTALLAVLVAVPAAYLLKRRRFRGITIIDTILDIPIVLPPLVVGLSLLILFTYPPFALFSRSVVYQVPAIILAQFMVATAFAIRSMEATFEQLSPRTEEVALTLGCSRWQAFWRVVLPEADRGIMAAAALAWARSLGEFGPVLIFAGATRFKTEVLATSVFLELTIGDLEAAVAVSLIMVTAAMIVLVFMRLWGRRHLLN